MNLQEKRIVPVELTVGEFVRIKGGGDVVFEAVQVDEQSVTIRLRSGQTKAVRRDEIIFPFF